MKLEVSELACERGGHRVFERVSFTLDGGGMLMLTGPNGAGKSSLLRLLAGLASPAAGRILIDGGDATRNPQAHADRLAYVGHADALKPALTVTENLTFWTRLQRGRRDVAAPVSEALEAMGLTPLAGTPARYLSAGQRRRTALARALASGAPIWLLDEPLTALDTNAVRSFAQAVGTHLARGGLAVVSSHVPVEGATDRFELGAAA